MDKSKKEIADRVVRNQGDQEVEHAYATCAANWCSWFERGFPSCSFVLRSILCDFVINLFLFLSSTNKSYEMSCVSWVDEDLALLVSHRLAPRGEA